MKVSIVIPVKNSQRTILQTVQSILAQTYRDFELLVVGDQDDVTWEALNKVNDKRLRLIEVPPLALKPWLGPRDSNYKRNVGLALAVGDVLVLTDSDMVFASDWLEKGLRILAESDCECIAGGMKSINPGFWGDYTDNVVFGAKTPRIPPEGYRLSKEMLGGKPPVTANLFFTRKLYEAVGGLDETFRYTYDDYEWAQRMVKADYAIFNTTEITGDHYHRQGWRSFAREYYQSGRGTWEYVCKYPDSFWAKKRRKENLMVAVVTTAFLATAVNQIVFLLAVSIGTLGLLALGVVTAVKTQKRIGVIYPFVTLVLGWIYTGGFFHGSYMAWLWKETKKDDFASPFDHTEAHEWNLKKLPINLINNF